MLPACELLFQAAIVLFASKDACATDNSNRKQGCLLYSCSISFQLVKPKSQADIAPCASKDAYATENNNRKQGCMRHIGMPGRHRAFGRSVLDLTGVFVIISQTALSPEQREDAGAYLGPACH